MVPVCGGGGGGGRGRGGCPVLRAPGGRPGSVTLSPPGEMWARTTQPPGHKDKLPRRPVARGLVELEVRLGRSDSSIAAWHRWCCLSAGANVPRPV